MKTRLKIVILFFAVDGSMLAQGPEAEAQNKSAAIGIEWLFWYRGFSQAAKEFLPFYSVNAVTTLPAVSGRTPPAYYYYENRRYRAARPGFASYQNKRQQSTPARNPAVAGSGLGKTGYTQPPAYTMPRKNIFCPK
jgi:hypothetical protein